MRPRIRIVPTNAQEAAGWEAALDQAGQSAGKMPPDGQIVPGTTATSAQLSGASAAALAALWAAEAEATRAAVLKARSCYHYLVTVGMAICTIVLLHVSHECWWVHADAAWCKSRWSSKVVCRRLRHWAPMVENH